MKIKLFKLVFMLLITAPAFAQNFRLNGYGAYVFDDQVDSRYDANNYYEGTIQGGFQWGVGAEFLIRETKGIELKYIRQDTKAPMKYNYNYTGGFKTKTFDVGINYILIGGSNYFSTGNDKIEPYFGLGLGAAFFDIKNAEAGADGSSTKFAWELKGGTNIWFSEKVGLKLQVDLLSAVQGAGGGLYFGTGGAGAGVSTYSTMYQFGLGGGLVFNFAKQTQPQAQPVP